MKFKYYFFKENTRTFDKADLLEYLNDTKYMSLDMDSRETEKIAYYNNEDINLQAQFILGEKSVVKNTQKLSPKYLDLNIRVEIELLYPNYKLGKILNIIEIICKRYNFCVYCEVFSDVMPYNRKKMIQAYQMIKQVYKEKNEEEFMHYAKIEPQTLEHVYQYIEQRDYLKETYKEFNADPLQFEFYRRPGSRQAYICSKWDGLDPFIVPGDTQLFVYDDGIVRKVIRFDELLKNINKMLQIIDTGLFNIYMLNPKFLKKVKKNIIKTKYPELQITLKDIELKDILDL